MKYKIVNSKHLLLGPNSILWYIHETFHPQLTEKVEEEIEVNYKSQWQNSEKVIVQQ